MAGLPLAEAEDRDADEYGSAEKPIGGAALPNDASRPGQGDGLFQLVIGGIATLEIAALLLWLLGS